MTVNLKWQLKRGTNADRTSYTPVEGELVYATDTKRVWVGDGTTAGGVDPFATDPYGDVYNVMLYGAVGDGITDDGPAIQAAIDAAFAEGGGRVDCMNLPYLTGQTIVLKDGVLLRGSGGQRATTIIKGFNGDLIEMESLSAIHDINMDGDGATYTGRGVVATAGYSHSIERCRIVDTAGVALEFELDVGGGACILQVEASTTSPTTVAGVKVTTTAGQASPKFFSGLWLPGGIFDISASGSTGLEVQGFYITSILMSTVTDHPHFTGGRCALVGATMDVKGTNAKFTAVTFAGTLALSDCTSASFTNCGIDAITEDAATCSENKFDSFGAVYTPVWDQASGTQPAKGNGTISGMYSRSGHSCTVSINFTAGSTTTFGNNLTAYRISLPFRGDTSLSQTAIPVRLVCAGALSMTWASIGGDQAYFTMGDLGGSVRLGYPGTWANGDSIQATFTYSTK